MRAILPGTNWINLKAQNAPPRAWRNNLLWVAAIVVMVVGLYIVTSRISPRPPLEFLGLSISPHTLQWGVTGFGLFALVNFLQNMRLSDNQAFRVITGSPTLIICIVVGSLQTIINYGMMAFNPSFLLTYYDLTLSEAALQFGFVSAGMGIIGPLIWGPLSDRLNIRFPGAGRAWVAMFAMGVSPLLSFWVYYAPTPGDFYLRFVLYSLVLTGWLPPLYAILYEQVLPRMRAVTASTYLLASTILGLGIGPYVVGMMSDATGDLRTSMLAVNAAAVPIVLLLLVVARRASKDEHSLLQRAAQPA